MAKPENVSCPECGGPMVSRANRRDGTRFWGCADYPRCRGTRNTDGEAPEERTPDLPSNRIRDRDGVVRWRFF